MPLLFLLPARPALCLGSVLLVGEPTGGAFSNQLDVALPSGVYLVRLQTATATRTRRMTRLD